ncbi:MAG TPA: hypothetical protein PLC28_21325, partial [Spirochaetota bacterium]|nr:hypothetical protein [Spirochaetota bacterium]HQJ73264.1 hypothetical protein [Spirochaetota bacterium]
MKKAVIAVAILSLFALVYFVCGDSEITDGSKNPLMTSTAGSRDGTSSPDDEEQASGSDEEKEGQEEVKKAAENTVTFTVR